MEADETLMAAVAVGDGAALAELCRRWEQPLFRLLARQTGGRDVDDLYQETWLRVVRGAGRFGRGRPFRPWLFQIAINCCRDWARRRRVDPLEHTAEPVAEPAGSPTARIDAAIDAERLLATLPAAQREAVVLRYYHDLPEGEVAEILGCPRGTVKSRLHHAIARLVAAVRGGTPAAAPRGARMIGCADVDELRAFGRALPADAEAHVRACARCGEHEAALAAVSAALAASAAHTVPAGLTARVLATAAPLLAANAAREARRRLLRALAAGLAPLPAILVLDFWLVRAGYDLLTRFLPDALSLWVVANWVGFLALLLALTYGAIPILAARQGPALQPRSA